MVALEHTEVSVNEGRVLLVPFYFTSQSQWLPLLFFFFPIVLIALTFSPSQSSGHLGARRFDSAGTWSWAVSGLLGPCSVGSVLFWMHLHHLHGGKTSWFCNLKKNTYLIMAVLLFAEHGLSPVGVSGGYSLVAAWASHRGSLSCCWGWALGHVGFRSCGTWS